LFMKFIQDSEQVTRGFSLATPLHVGGPDISKKINGLALRHNASAPRSTIPPREIVSNQAYSDLVTYITEEDSAFWCFMDPQARPSFTHQLLVDLADMQSMIKQLFAGGAEPFNYFILASRSQGVFNLGGDLTLFADKIREGDREGLRHYAYSCVETGHTNYRGYDNGVVTIALMQGDALGGGLECALSCDVLIAERHAKFGLPEVLFNLFPGMGAYSYLARRVGMLKAEEMILGGRTYTAEEMLALGAIDMVVEPGEGEHAVRSYIARNHTRQQALSTVYKARRRVNPVSLDELRDVTDLWVDAAMRLSEQDLRRMSRIAAAQDRFRRRSAEMAAVQSHM
jgi:DSF synthase